MLLPIDIEDLLNKRKVESNRIEFKTGWNPVHIYQTICAFANDFDNIGGGYILVGVEEVNGVAKRPVKGISLTEVDSIQKAMVGFNNLIQPYYLPRVSVEEVDGHIILVIWIPAGINRPYEVPRDITAHVKRNEFYIRTGTSTIEAKGEVLNQLRDMANRIPFDDRGNAAIKVDDISPVLVREYLIRVKSRLADDFKSEQLADVLESMNLLEGPAEKRMVKNVAAMMFCDHMRTFFPKSQVDIVMFPEGRVNNPNNMIEVPAITGAVPQIIRGTLEYLRTNVIKEYIVKPKDDEHSIKTFNYPYQALEEAVVNALYHRDYQERQPVEITIEPDHISILSYSGPDRSISIEDIRQAVALRSRRYRNVRLGDFLKELNLTEGRATGIPTIQDELRKNGSDRAVLHTDENRTFFLIDIPCHPDFVDHRFRTFNNVDEDSVRRSVLLLMSRIVPSLYQVDSIHKLADNERVIQLLNHICTKSDNLCTKSLELWSDIRILEVVVKVVSALRNEVALKELLGLSNQKNRTRFKKLVVDPLLILGLAEMTIPDKPNSRHQLYKLSSLGRQYFF